MRYILVNTAVFIFTVLLFTGLYYFFDQAEINESQDFSFVVYALIGGSSVFFAPWLEKAFKYILSLFNQN